MKMLQRNQSQKMKSKKLFKEWRPEWNDAISDLSIHKASPQELERKKLICKSKHAEVAKLELKSKKIYSKTEKQNENLEEKKSLIKELLLESNELLRNFDSSGILTEKVPQVKKHSKYRTEPIVTPAPDFRSSLSPRQNDVKPISRSTQDFINSPNLNYVQLKSPRSDQGLKMCTGLLHELKDVPGNNVKKLDVFNQLLSNLSKALTEMEKKLSSEKSSSHELLDEFRNSIPSINTTDFVEKLLCILCRLLHFIQSVTCETEKEHRLREELNIQIQEQGLLIDELTLELIHVRKEVSKRENSESLKNRDLETDYSSSGDVDLLKSSSVNILTGWMKSLCPSHSVSNGRLNKSLSLPDFRLISAFCEKQHFKNKILPSGMAYNLSKEILENKEGSQSCRKPAFGNKESSREMNLERILKTSEGSKPILSSKSISHLVYSEGFNPHPRFTTPSVSVPLAETVALSPWLQIPFQPAIMLTVPQQCDVSGISPLVETNTLWFDSSCMIKELKKISPSNDKISMTPSLPRLTSISEDVGGNQYDCPDKMHKIDKLISNSACDSMEASSSSLNENLELSESSDSHKICRTVGSGKPNPTTPASDVLGNDDSNRSDTTLSDMAVNKPCSLKNKKELDINALVLKLKALQDQYFSAQLQLKSLMTTTSSNNYQNREIDEQFLPVQKLSVS